MRAGVEHAWLVFWLFAEATTVIPFQPGELSTRPLITLSSAETKGCVIATRRLMLTSAGRWLRWGLDVLLIQSSAQQRCSTLALNPEQVKTRSGMSQAALAMPSVLPAMSDATDV